MAELGTLLKAPRWPQGPLTHSEGPPSQSPCSENPLVPRVLVGAPEPGCEGWGWGVSSQPSRPSGEVPAASPVKWHTVPATRGSIGDSSRNSAASLGHLRCWETPGPEADASPLRRARPTPPHPALWVQTPGKASARPLPSNQELISGHFGEDGASYETEIRELTDLRQVGGPVPPRCPATPRSLMRRLSRERKNGAQCRRSHCRSHHLGAAPGTVGTQARCGYARAPTQPGAQRALRMRGTAGPMGMAASCLSPPQEPCLDLSPQHCPSLVPSQSPGAACIAHDRCAPV